ncbi:MAG TPA: YraN family protein [Gemmatimonadales bacterium]|jgi:putative endonuclease
MSLKSDPRTWTDQRHLRGLEGERVAARYLLARGWRLEAHRFRMGRLEIDLVMRRLDLVAFVEVKTRETNRYGSAVEAVTWTKRREIERVAQAWIDRHGRRSDTYRLDVIGVTLHSPGGPTVVHVPDAFRAGWR